MRLERLRDDIGRNPVRERRGAAGSTGAGAGCEPGMLRARGHTQ
jgi:hypothetical protein